MNIRYYRRHLIIYILVVWADGLHLTREYSDGDTPLLSLVMELGGITGCDTRLITHRWHLTR